MAKCKDCFHWNACKKMLETYWGHCIPSDYEGGADRCEDFISTADVAPRVEVARKIFEEIEKTADACIESEWLRGSWFNMSKFKESLAELKNKYAEGRNER